MKPCETCGEAFQPYRFNWQKFCSARCRMQSPRSVDAQYRRNLRKLYGTDWETYQAMYTRAGGKCEICRQPEVRRKAGRTKRLALDHDHATGALRGILCHACNLALEQLADRLETVEAYLRRAPMVPA